MFFRRSRTAYFVVRCQNWPNFELIQAFMDAIFTGKLFLKDPIKNSRESTNTLFLHHNPMGAICCHGNMSSDPIFMEGMQIVEVDSHKHLGFVFVT